MDLHQLPLDVLNIIFSHIYRLENRLAARLVSKGWRVMVSRLPVSLHRLSAPAAGERYLLQKLEILFSVFPRLSTLDCRYATFLQSTHLTAFHPLQELKRFTAPNNFDADLLKGLVQVPASLSIREMTLTRQWQYTSGLSLKRTRVIPGAEYLTHFTRLESLCLSEMRLAEAVSALAQLRLLTNLALDLFVLPGEIARLSSLTRLRVLALNCAGDTEDEQPDVSLNSDDMLTIGSAFYNLTALNFTFAQFDMRHMSFLTRLTALVELDVPVMVATHEAYDYMMPFRLLTKLTLNYGMPFPAQQLIQLSRSFTGLKEIELPFNATITDEHLETCSYFPLLAALDFDNAVSGIYDLDDDLITDDGVRHLSRLTFATSLYLHQRKKLTSSSAAVFAMLSRLEVLSLAACSHIPADSMLQFAVLTRLLSLDLSFTSVTNGVVDILLQRMTRLTRLTLTRTNVSSIERISALQNLGSLNVSGTQVDDEAIIAIAPLTSLYSLAVTATRISGVTFAGARFARLLSHFEVFELDFLQFKERYKRAPPLHVTARGAAIFSSLFQNTFFLRSDYRLPFDVLRAIVSNAGTRYTSLRLHALDRAGLDLLVLHCIGLVDLALSEPEITTCVDWEPLTRLTRLRCLTLHSDDGLYTPGRKYSNVPAYFAGSHISVRTSDLW